MRVACAEPVLEATLLDYWAGDLAGEGDIDRVEAHLFECAGCSARLERLVALGAGVAALARQGRISGIVSRALLNRLQRDGVHVRMYSLAPGETVPCAVYPGDDIIVTHLRADFSNADTVKLSVTGPGGAPFDEYDEVPVAGALGEVLWATPASRVRPLPSIRLEITLTSTGADGTELGRYVLEHSAMEQSENPGNGRKS